MVPSNVFYDVKCMLCGTEVGQVLGGTFKQHADCSAPMPRQAGTRRCCHCGGSLYFDPIEGYHSPVQLPRVAQIDAA